MFDDYAYMSAGIPLPIYRLIDKFIDPSCHHVQLTKNMARENGSKAEGADRARTRDKSRYKLRDENDIVRWIGIDWNFVGWARQRIDFHSFVADCNGSFHSTQDDASAKDTAMHESCSVTRDRTGNSRVLQHYLPICDSRDYFPIGLHMFYAMTYLIFS